MWGQITLIIQFLMKLFDLFKKAPIEKRIDQKKERQKEEEQFSQTGRPPQ